MMILKVSRQENNESFIIGSFEHGRVSSPKAANVNSPQSEPRLTSDSLDIILYS